MRTLERRLDALECVNPAREPLLIVWRVVSPERPEEDPSGTHAAPPHLPALNRAPGESWSAFVDRLGSMIEHLPVGMVVRVIGRCAGE